METSNKIAVRIHGNRLGNAGFEPILSLNATSEFPQLVYEGCPGMASNPFYFTIQISNQYTRYMLLHNNVRSFGAARDGLLKMAIGIPRGYRLDGERNPYDLLLQIRDYFVSTYMDEGLNNVYSFKETINSEELKEGVGSILSGYPLVLATNQPYRPMATDSGRPAVLLISRDRIRMLFKDVQYSEFSPYNQIVVAEQGDKTQYFVDLSGRIQIPRKPNIRLFLNNNELPVPADGNVNVNVLTALNKSSEAYENQQLQFKVEDILNGSMKPGVSYDPLNERIDCNVPLTKKTKRIYIRLSESQGVDYSDFYAMWNGKLFPFSKQELEIVQTGEEILQRDVTVSYYGRGIWQVENSHPLAQNIEGKQIYIIKLKKKPPIIPQSQLDSYGRKTSTPSYYIQLNLDRKFLQEWKTANPKDDGDNLKSFRVNVTCNSCSLHTRTVLQGNSKDKYYRIELPQDWRSSPCSIELLDQNLIYEPAYAGKEYDLSSFYKSHSKRKSERLKPIFWYIVCILVGLVFGYVLGNLLNSKNKENPAETPSTGVVSDNKSNEPKFDREGESKKYQNYVQRMLAEDLSFDEVKEIDNWIRSLTPEQKSQIGVNDMFVTHVQVYNEIVNTIKNNSDAKALKSALNEKKTINGESISVSKIMESHLCYLRAAYMGLYNNPSNPDDGFLYTADGKNRAMSLYNENHATFTSFKDIYSMIEPHTKSMVERKKDDSKGSSNSKSNSVSRGIYI